LELAAELMQSTPTAAERCKKGSEHLADGANLAEALEKAEVLPPSSCRLLAVALRGGTTDAVMQEISERLSEEADEELFAQTARIEPSLVLVASLLVGLILLSVMLPLMHIMTAIG
jgi:type IV pilus assembly protein PilC